jgi:hypothetical protein
VSKVPAWCGGYKLVSARIFTSGAKVPKLMAVVKNEGIFILTPKLSHSLHMTSKTNTPGGVADVLISVNFTAVANNAYDNLAGRGIGKVEHPIITDPDAPTIPISKFLATVWKRIVFKSQNCPGHAGLNVSR